MKNSKAGFKSVPAIDKCFCILDLLAKSKEPLGISQIARSLSYNKSTVFNMVYTMVELGVLENSHDGKFRFGTRLYLLGKVAEKASDLISTVHPYLEKVSQELKLSAFLGIRSAMKVTILDKVDSALDMRISSEIGMTIPLLAGAGGKILLAQLPEEEVEEILSRSDLPLFTRNSCTDKTRYRAMVRKVREEGIAIDMEEYIEGVRALAVPLNSHKGGNPCAIWAVGLKRQIREEDIPGYSDFLKGIACDIRARITF